MTILTASLIGKVVSFNTYAPAVLGTAFNNVKILGFLDSTGAMAFEDVAALHANVYGAIPVPQRPADDFESYAYLKIKLPNGTIKVIGEPWINGDITIQVNKTITAVISNVSGSDVENIRKTLIANGYNDVVINIA